MNTKEPKPLLSIKQRKTLSAAEQLNLMLQRMSFEDLLRKGYVLDIEGASYRTGYSQFHIRRLCAGRKVPHLLRNETQYFFLPWQIQGVFKAMAATSARA